MPQPLLHLDVTPQQLSYEPGGALPQFGATVTNCSDRFASLQLALRATGLSDQPPGEWYRVEPEVSAKIPPGDRCEFRVVAIAEHLQRQLALEQHEAAAPSGTVDLEVRAFSLDLAASEERAYLRLAIAPDRRPIVLPLALPQRHFREAPGTRFAIGVDLQNPSYHQSATVRLDLLGLPSAWLPDGARQTLTLAPRQATHAEFICALPLPSDALADRCYLFDLQAVPDGGTPSTTAGTLEIQVDGTLDFTCTPRDVAIPPRPRRPRLAAGAGSTTLEITNHSNAAVPVAIAVEPVRPARFRVEATCEPSPPDGIVPPQASRTVQVTLTPAPRQGIARVLTWVVRQRATLRANAIATETSPLDWSEDRTLTALVHPRLPLWLTGLAGLFALGACWWLSFLNPDSPLFYHRGAVNSVQLNGRGTDAISGASDARLIEWDVEGFRQVFANPERQRVRVVEPTAAADETAGGKAVRVVRFRPFENDRVAVGLENGTIQVWNLLDLENADPQVLVQNRANRVLDLRFAPDSRSLYSGHGDGLLLEWHLDRLSPSDAGTPQLLPTCPGDRPFDPETSRQLANTADLRRARQLDFAIYSLAWVGADPEYLAAAGERNQLVLLDPTLNRCQPIPYNSGGIQSDYITAIASAPERPALFASADNRGTISVWRIATATADPSVTLVDRWQAGAADNLFPAIRGLALTADACYLVSGGDDARVVLWPLAASGQRAPEYPEGVRLFPNALESLWFALTRSRARRAIHSVDIRRVGDTLYVASGSQDTQVRLRFPPLPARDRQCLQR